MTGEGKKLLRLLNKRQIVRDLCSSNISQQLIVLQAAPMGSRGGRGGVRGWEGNPEQHRDSSAFMCVWCWLSLLLFSRCFILFYLCSEREVQSFMISLDQCKMYCHEISISRRTVHSKTEFLGFLCRRKRAGVLLTQSTSLLEVSALCCCNFFSIFMPSVYV